MLFPNDILIRIIIFVFGLCGFWVARHIFMHKKAKKTLVCPVGFDCNFVVHSDYSQFLHVPIEIFGMFYYAVFSLIYLYFILFAKVMPNIVSLALLGASLGAFLFSLYLLWVQIFILKKGCSWCIVSAFISVSIFVLIVCTYDFGFVLEILNK
jgi:uncharacterized membrane protein